MRSVLALGLLTATAAFGYISSANAAEPAQCNRSAGAVSFVELPGSPFAAVPTQDGCAIFVSLVSDRPGVPNGIAVLSRSGGTIAIERFLGDNDTPYGMVLTHDGKSLIVANNTNVVVLDVERLLSGQGNPLAGYISEPGNMNPLSIYVNVTSDDRFLFIADENADRITVIDLVAARRGNFAEAGIVGAIPVGFAPIALTFSPDGRFLYVTTQQASDEVHWPVACKPEGEDPVTSVLENPQGSLVVVDVARARTNPANSVIATIPAGCSPVRLALSPKGDRAYVTARADNALIIFDTTKFVSDPDHARIATVPVGTAPVGITVIEEGKRVIVANSDRFSLGTSGREALVFIDTASVGRGKAAITTRVRAGLFPRELATTTDGKTLLVTNSDSDQLELVDLTQVPAP